VNTLGGGERSVLEVGRALLPRHDVRLLLGRFQPRTTFAELASLPYARLGRVQWPVARVVADAIVTNSFGANLLALRNGSHTAYWVHSMRSIFLQPGRRRVDLLARRAVDRLAVRRTRLLVANSRFTARRLQALYGREADMVVYPGVDLALYRPGRPAGSYAITVGRLSPEKGLDRLLAIWRELPDVPLRVIGDGPADQVRALRAAAPSGVVFRGPLAASELAQEYRGAAVAVFAPYGEEFGLAPLEAMASGVPVVGWRDGGLPETVVDGKTGYLVSDEVSFRQRVRLIARDRRARNLLGDAARARAEQFSWQQTATEIERLCLRLRCTPNPATSELSEPPRAS
jgi:glycosyltransferase involved in cell wall biosynthesis